MIPLGYMAKRIPEERPDWLEAPDVVDVYSISDCVNDSLATYTSDWPHNGYWMFDSPAVIKATLTSNRINIQQAKLFFYEAHELEFDENEQGWFPVMPDSSFRTEVSIPADKNLQGFDVVTFCDGPNSHSPLSCNSVAKHVKTNQHCLFKTLDEAVAALTGKAFDGSEPGPYRICAVYLVSWP
jgi:hypothetical protein